jgi:hypothetical protein
VPRTCVTMTLHNELVQASEMYRTNRRNIEAFNTALRRARAARRTEVVRIPVVVHVLHHDPAQNVSDAQIQSQIAVLNKDFRKLNQDLVKVPEPFRPFIGDAMIEFGLAIRDPGGQPTNGITRTQTSRLVFQPDTADPNRQIIELDRKIKTVAGGGAAAWPANRYLNIWVCNMGRDPLGYAQFPGGAAETDGVVIDFKAFGLGGTAEAPFDLGRTATHEIGHWFNLLHIWGDDGLECSGSDSVEDTPNQGRSSRDIPVFPQISCNNGPHGDMFMNFMDYTDDAGMQMFTAGQIERMTATLNGPRASMLSSNGLTPPDQIAAVRFPEFVAFLASPRLLPEEVGARVTKAFDGVSWV